MFVLLWMLPLTLMAQESKDSLSINLPSTLTEQDIRELTAPIRVENTGYIGTDLGNNLKTDLIETGALSKPEDYKPQSRFEEYHGTLTEAQVRKETARCLSCGASVVDENKCIGCGICTTKCAFDAIHLHRELPEASHMRTSEGKFGGILPYMIKRAGKIAFKKSK